MKRIITLILTVLVAVVTTAFASTNVAVPVMNGSKGETVRQVQTQLVELGYLNGSIDGIFGNGTENAVKAFQEDCGIEVTGIVDETTYEAIHKAMIPEGVIVDEIQWENWTATGKCKLFPFKGAGKQAGFTFSIPSGQEDSSHKKCTFIFSDDTEDTSLKNVEMYYCVEDQTILYVGLWTDDINILGSEAFKEACIRLMLGYNIHYDRSIESAVLNLSREHVEEVVSYCLEYDAYCLADDMRIRVIRNEEDAYYSFHMEY